MPLKMWRHTCCKESKGHLTATDRCPACGRPGECVGWQYSMLESKALYQKIYGLKPSGSHRALADRLFGEFRANCFYCGGNGLLDAPAEETYAVCPMCNGNGHFLNLDGAAADALRAQVLAEYPDAAAPRSMGTVAGAALIQDLSNGLVLDANDPDAGAEG